VRNKNVIFLIIFLLLVFPISGCFPSQNNQEEEDQMDSLETKTIISPSVVIDEQFYRGVLPYQSSPIKGLLSKIPARLDAKQFELGLLELAKTRYAPSTYIFQEGQILNEKDITPFFQGEQYPQYQGFLYAVTEQDYLLEDGSTDGIVLGLLVSPTYTTEIDGKQTEKRYTQEELEEKAKVLAKDIVSIVRMRDQQASILVGVMKAQTEDIKVPGSFFLVGEVKKNEDFIDEWNKIDEKYLFLPADPALKEEYGEVARGFNHLKEKMDQYLPGFTGITGIARFVDGELLELTMKVYTEFDSTVELIQFMQFGATMIPEYFPKDHQLNFYVYTIDQPQAIYIQKVNGENFMHIFRD